MPRGAPFTQLCQLASPGHRAIVADLHSHSTASDGESAPAEVVALALKRKLRVLSLTDHDTFAGYSEAFIAARDAGLSLVVGAELSCEWVGREVHLLGYFPAVPGEPLSSECSEMQQTRRLRFDDAIERLRFSGAAIAEECIEQVCLGVSSLGRRHLTKLLKLAGVAADSRTAWASWLGPIFGDVLPKRLIPLERACALIATAGGFNSLAHPHPELERTDFESLRAVGLTAIEVNFPAAKSGRRTDLERWARELGLHRTGGSDFHSIGPLRELGQCGLTGEEFARLPVRAI